MSTLVFATTNKAKFALGASTCSTYDIGLIQKPLEIDEIQEEDVKRIALDKAQKAFDIVKQPVIISDDSWAIHGLNGFPGAYMHSINHWFTPQDLLNLTIGLKDRRVTLTQSLVYQDEKGQQYFSGQTDGTLLKELRGPESQPNHMLVCLDGDNGLTIAERLASGKSHDDRAAAKIWHEFADWHKNRS